MQIGTKTKLAGAAALIAIAAWALWPPKALGVELKASIDGGATPMASTPLANVPSPANVAVQRTAVDARAPAAVQRVVRCQLTGLHTNAPWSVRVEVRFPAEPASEAVFAQPDANGAFTFAAPAGRDGFAARLIADDPNYAAVDVTASLAPELHAHQPYEIHVQPIARVVGTVVDFRGTPVPRALVSAHAWIDGAPRGPHTDTTTGPEGQFRIKVPLQSELFLVAIAMQDTEERERAMAQGAQPPGTKPRDDLLPAIARAPARFGEATDVGTLMLDPPAQITGELRDPQGRPVAGERVHWWPSPGSCDLEITRELTLAGPTWDDLIVAPWASTDERGAFRLVARNGQRGTMYFAQGPSLLEPFTDMREITAPVHVPIQLGGNTAVLRVMQGGSPVPGAYMLWEKFRGGVLPRTDERGELRLLRSKAEVQKVTLKARGLKVDVELPLDTAPDRPIVLDLGEAVLAPVEFDVTSAITVQQFSAMFRATGSKSSDSRIVKRDAEGRYRCDVGPGDYELWVGSANKAEGDDRFLCAQRVQVAVPVRGVRCAISIQHGGRLRVQARDAHGVHLAGVVTLTRPDGTAAKPGLQDAKGYFSNDGRLAGDGPVVTNEILVPGTWQVELDLGVRGIHRRTVEVRSTEITEVDVTLQ